MKRYINSYLNTLLFFLFYGIFFSSTSQTLYERSGKLKSTSRSVNTIASTLIQSKTSTIPFITAPSFQGASHQKLQLSRSTPSIVRDKRNSLPIFIQQPLKNISPTIKSLHEESVSTLAYFSLEEISKYFNVTSSLFVQQWKLESIQVDPMGGCKVLFQQYHNQIKMEDGVAILHIDKNKNVTNWTGHYIPTSISTTYSISEEEAIQGSLETLQSYAYSYQDLPTSHPFLPITVSKVILQPQTSIVSTPTLCYKMDVRRHFAEWITIYINGSNGQIIERVNNICSIDGPTIGTGLDLNNQTRTIQTYLKGSTHYLLDISRNMYTPSGSVLPQNPLGAITTYNLNNTFGNGTNYSFITSNTTSWNNPTAVSAHYNAAKAYEYFYTVHGRNSINNQGGTIVSFINVSDPNSGQSMDNAFWNGQAIFYGNGNTAFKPLAGGLDVAGHELTHGVIQNSANLRYSFESGAINESMADIFGCMIDSLDWLIGEDVVLTNAFPSGALRSMSDPHNGGSSLNDNGYQPKKVSEQYLGTADNGGVHINSGIPNYAFYLFATSSSRSIAARIFYRALTEYLTRSSNFIDLRIACVQACTEIYPNNAGILAALNAAFDTVEIFIPTGGGNNGNTVLDDIPLNPGMEQMVFINTVRTPAYPAVVYRFNENGNPFFTALANNTAYNKVSVSDNGKVAAYVNVNKNILTFNATSVPSTNLSQLTNSGFWSYVAVSKDGTKIAATSIERDTSIFVYEFATNQWTQFKLYNPTFTDGLKSGGPIYADALEWDHTGQYLVYDCYNEFENNDGTSLSYWDVNFIKVWDNTTQTVGNGEVTKLFSSLPKGIGIGNPTYAKNSSKILAFDLFDELNNELYVVACNIETNDLAYVTADLLTNPLATFGRPNYNNTDDVIAFSYSDADGEFVVTIDMESDKINSVNPNAISVLLTESKWPVYFANGTRSLPTSILTGKPSNTDNITIYPNPGNDQATLRINDGSNEWSTISIFQASGQVVRTYKHPLAAGENEIPLPVSEISKGLYIIYVETSSRKWVSRWIKQ